MHTAISPIAFKGFMLGYLHKTAEEDNFTQKNESPADGSKKSTYPGDQKDDAAAKKSGGDGGSAAPSGGGSDSPYDLTSAKALGSQLSGLWPGAAAGAVGVGGASLGIDAIRKKPMNVKRAILLSLLLGVPLGAAGQVGIQGGIQGFTDIGKQFGRAGAEAGSNAAALAGMLKQKGQQGWEKGKAAVGSAVDKGMGAAKKVGANAMERIKTGNPETRPEL